MGTPTRRTVAKGAAWAVPVIAVAVPARAVAASGSNEIVGHQECKCPGDSHPDAPKTYVFTVVFDNPVSTFSINGPVVVDGRPRQAGGIIQISPTTWSFRFIASSSADISGDVTFVYTADGVTQAASYHVSATPPCKNGEC